MTRHTWQHINSYNIKNKGTSFKFILISLNYIYDINAVINFVEINAKYGNCADLINVVVCAIGQTGKKTRSIFRAIK